LNMKTVLREEFDMILDRVEYQAESKVLGDRHIVDKFYYAGTHLIVAEQDCNCGVITYKVRDDVL